MKRCYICGQPVSGMDHHIVTRGSGGNDEPYNLITLCVRHHREIDIGWKTFINKYPETRQRIIYAREKQGRRII